MVGSSLLPYAEMVDVSNPRTIVYCKIISTIFYVYHGKVPSDSFSPNKPPPTPSARPLLLIHDSGRWDIDGEFGGEEGVGV
jgi:hypothetical protein